MMPDLEAVYNGRPLTITASSLGRSHQASSLQDHDSIQSLAHLSGITDSDGQLNGVRLQSEGAV